MVLKLFLARIVLFSVDFLGNGNRKVFGYFVFNYFFFYVSFFVSFDVFFLMNFFFLVGIF